MSVILFHRSEVYQEMADAYEGLKPLLRPWSEIDDAKFYKSLRRMYFANVAAYLCQYHDDSPLSFEELTHRDVFNKLRGVADDTLSHATQLKQFVSAWYHLRYNLITNDGERFTAEEADEYLTNLVSYGTRSLLEEVG